MLKIIGIIIGVVFVFVILTVCLYGLALLIKADRHQGNALFKRFMVAFALIVLVLVILAGIKGYQIYSMIQKFSHTKQETIVSDEAARLETWAPYFTAVGNLAPVEGVQVSNQLAGSVTGIYFQSGTQVKKGQLLVQLDDSSQRAQLLGFQAQVKLAEFNLKREQELVRRKLDSQANLDTAANNLEQAKSNLLNDQTSIDKLGIRAPFSGRIGIRNVNLGQYLAVGTSIADLQSLDTMYAQFTLPEQDLATLARGQRVDVTVDAYPKKIFSGELTAIDSAVDPNTHNVTLQATIHNPEHLLRAGMFANVHIYAGEPEPAITVPNTAVDYSLYGSSVFIVKQDGKDADGKPVLKVSQVFVTTGQVRDGRVAIDKGLKPGDVVVTAGQQKLQNGMQVEINNSVKTD
ncbi:MAG: efflux RND transporter periplasmic adaptor subunit [Gammaproteobacteria bacterium]